MPVEEEEEDEEKIQRKEAINQRNMGQMREQGCYRVFVQPRPAVSLDRCHQHLPHDLRQPHSQ